MGETFPFNLTPGTDCPRWPLEVWVREAAMFGQGDVNALPDIFCHRGFVTPAFVIDTVERLRWTGQQTDRHK